MKEVRITPYTAKVRRQRRVTPRIRRVVGWESFLAVTQMFYQLDPAITSQRTGLCHSSVHTITTEQGRSRGAGGVALRQRGQFCRKPAFLERQVGLGHACAAAVPTPLDVKRLLNVFPLVSAGGFLILKCSVTTVRAWWRWGIEILLENWMWQKFYCQNKRKV